MEIEKSKSASYAIVIISSDEDDDEDVEDSADICRLMTLTVRCCFSIDGGRKKIMMSKQYSRSTQS